MKHAPRLGLTLLCLTMMASGAQAATLKISVPHRVVHNQPQFYVGAQAGAYEKYSPFTRSDRLIAKATGRRHICAYLYPQYVGPTETTRPMATADAPYRVVRGS